MMLPETSVPHYDATETSGHALGGSQKPPNKNLGSLVLDFFLNFFSF